MATGQPATIKLDTLKDASDELAYTQERCSVNFSLNPRFTGSWKFPLDPIVSVSGSKTIIRRNVAKKLGSGSVKEQWSSNDYEITISGLLQGEEAYPETDVSRLRSFLHVGQSVFVSGLVFQLLGIDRICIESWDFPHTPGLENQEFSITAYSDEYFDLT